MTAGGLAAPPAKRQPETQPPPGYSFIFIGAFLRESDEYSFSGKHRTADQLEEARETLRKDQSQREAMAKIPTVGMAINEFLHLVMTLLIFR
jgi:hypothetical protein